MKPTKSGKKKSTATASPIKRPSQAKSEREFLANRAQEARLALRQSLRELARQAVGIVNLKAWTEHHPIGTTGAAAFAGLMLARPVPVGRAKPSAGGPAEAEPPKPGETSPSPWISMATLLVSTGADLAKDVLTPVLQEMLRPQKTPEKD